MIAHNPVKSSLHASRQTARRQANIREAWSPWERRERARQASAQINLLWTMIQSNNNPR